MGLLAINVAGAYALGAELRRAAMRADTAAGAVEQAASLVDLAGSTTSRLYEVADCVRAVASAVDHAAALAEAFELAPLIPSGQRPAVRDLQWHELRQVADHNTYAQGTIDDQRARGRYSHEFDLHIGAPTRFEGATDSGLGPWAGVGGVVADALTHGERLQGDWRVYHSSLDPRSAYDSLGTALDDVAAAAGPVPMAIFLDMKDPLVEGHDAKTLDAMLRERLGDRLWSPRELLAAAGTASTLQQAIDAIGWPTVGELDGRVMVVLTGQVREYREHPVADAAAFVAPAPDLDALSDPNVAVYNAHVRHVDDDVVAVIHAQNALLRVWGASSPQESEATRAANWIAID